jgi:hypothetical protein
MSVDRVGLPVVYTCTGFTVTALTGEKIGKVVGVTDACFVVEIRGWPFQSLRAIPFERAHVREADRNVVSLVARDAVRRSPPVRHDRAVPEPRVMSYYDVVVARLASRETAGARVRTSSS